MADAKEIEKFKADILRALNPPKAGLVDRLVTGVRYIIGGGVTPSASVDTAPFSPMQPIPPMFQDGMQGRQFDYQTGWNLIYKPRQDSNVSAAQLRAMADGYDLMRLAIETRKDQLAKLEFNIIPRDPEKKAKADKRCQEVEDFLQYPDKEHDFATWRRMLHEDLLVIDAPTVYPRMTKGGGLYSLDIMDGGMINRKLDGEGRTPMPPDPAYQVQIKGVPAVDYSFDELIYMPRNLRSYRAYGYSPVEQVIITVNIALRRQMHQLSYYTDGNLPDLIFTCPEDWNPSQIKDFQTWWNSLMQGDVNERRVAKFVPSGVQPYDIKQAALKDDYDEWLARIICFCFSLPPTAFIKQMNRATADTAKQQAEEEGLQPYMIWETNFWNRIIWKYFGYQDLKFKWKDEKEVDPQVQSEIDKVYLQEYVISPDEVRERMGMEGPAPEKPLPPMVGEPTNAPGTNPDNPDKKGGKVPPNDPKKKDKKVKLVMRKTAKKIPPIDRERDSIVEERDKLESKITDFLEIAGADIADQVANNLKMVAGDMTTEEQVAKVLADIDFKGWSLLIDPTKEALEKIYADGTKVALAQINFDVPEAMTNLLNQQAAGYAEARAAEMVGMKYVDGELVENPNAEWAITDSTRDILNSTITDSIKNGDSVETLKQNIMDSTGFSEYRARMIARTETAYADQHGNLAAYKESGVVTGKEWVVGSEHDNDDECDDNADAGVIALDDDFPSGDDAPPAHPNCACDIFPVVGEEE
jgi:SPP1 gp7 family putative phage head morphogenesis protein